MDAPGNDASARHCDAPELDGAADERRRRDAPTRSSACSRCSARASTRCARCSTTRPRAGAATRCGWARARGTGSATSSASSAWSRATTGTSSSSASPSSSTGCGCSKTHGLTGRAATVGLTHGRRRHRCQGREDRARRGDHRGASGRQVPDCARQRPRDPRIHGRQDAPVPDPHQPGRPDQGRALAVRPPARSHRLSLSLARKCAVLAPFGQRATVILTEGNSALQ